MEILRLGMMISEHSLQTGFRFLLMENCVLALCVIWCSSSSRCGGSVTDAQWLRAPCWAACVWLRELPEMDMVWGVRIAGTQRAAPALSASHIPPSGDRSPSLHLSIRSPICLSCSIENTWLPFDCVFVAVSAAGVTQNYSAEKSDQS